MLQTKLLDYVEARVDDQWCKLQLVQKSNLVAHSNSRSHMNFDGTKSGASKSKPWSLRTETESQTRSGGDSYQRETILT
jgi:hypothetical protein